MIITIGVAAAIVTIAIGVASGIWWVYRHGQDSGKAQAEYRAARRAQAEAQARIQIMEAKLAEIQAEMDRIRPRRPRVLLLEQPDLT